MDGEKKTQWRTSQELHGWVKSRAKQNGRSMNSELNMILAEKKSKEEKQAA